MTQTNWANALPPDLDDIAQAAAQAIAALPPAFAQEAARIALRVEEFAPEALLADMGCDNGFDLTGLYEGTPLTEKSVLDQPLAPDTIWLFRRPILDEWAARGDIALGHLVAHVYLHELAHHFGWSDDEIAQIAPWQD